MPKPKNKPASPTLAHVHVTKESVSSEEITPPHDPRTETPIYKAIHERLLFHEDRPCYTCGVRHSDLQDPTRHDDLLVNPYGAKIMESHHVVVERSLSDGVDPARVAQAFPSVHQFKTFIEWVDGSEDNIKPFCDQCHRLADHAIHHALWQDVQATKFALRGADGKPYIFAASAKDAAAALATDEAIERAAGIEQQVDAAMGVAPETSATPAAPALAPTAPANSPPRLLTHRLRQRLHQARQAKTAPQQTDQQKAA